MTIDKYTQLPDGTSRAGEPIALEIVQKAEPIINVVKNNSEVSIVLLSFAFFIIAGLFVSLYLFKIKKSSSDL